MNMEGIEKKLLSIQSKLKAPKGQYNSFGKYKYRSCEDILEAVKPLLKEHECALTIRDRIVMVGERYYVEATAVLSDAEGGNVIENTSYAREDESKKGMDGSQITGTASSYARKYALNGLFAIDDAKDADTDGYQAITNGPSNAEQVADSKKVDKINEGFAPEKVQPESATSEQVRQIHEFCFQTGTIEADVLKAYKKENFSELSRAQAAQAIRHLKDKANAV